MPVHAGGRRQYHADTADEPAASCRSSPSALQSPAITMRLEFSMVQTYPHLNAKSSVVSDNSRHSSFNHSLVEKPSEVRKYNTNVFAIMPISHK